MIKNKKVIIGILLTIFFIFANMTISLGIGYNVFRPDIPEAPNAIEMIENIFSVITIIGVVITVVLIGVIGFSSILGSASEKAVAQEKYMGLVFGALMITSISIIARFLISIAENMGNI